MTYDPADKRALFQRVVDDIIDQIRAGTLQPGDKLPSAKEISDRWDVSSMTSQRALRELQALGISYGMAGKGTYVHPEAHDKIAILDGEPVQTAEGITISAELATHLQYRELFLAKTTEWMDALLQRDKAKAAQLQAEMGLVQAIMEGQREELKDEIAKYQAALDAMTGPLPDPAAQPPADDESPKPARRRSTKK
jgi:DNA-binding transcriptional regulator YhcF (GntR family)